MGSSSSSSSSCAQENSNLDANERFQFRFTDCSCQCNANKKRDRIGGGGDNDLPQAALINAFLTPINRSQYDIQCACDCGEGVKLGFLFGNTSSTDH